MSKKPSTPIEGAECGNSEKSAPKKRTSQRSNVKKVNPNGESSKKPAKKTSQNKSESAGEKSAKKSAAEKQPTSKTPQVMRLVEQRRDVNPVILAGKSAIPRQLRGVEPLSRIMKREAELDDEGALVDLTAQLAAENAVPILRRFNACCCEKCAAELARITREKLPARFVRHGSEEYDEIREQLRKAVITQMVRELLGSRRRSFHE